MKNLTLKQNIAILFSIATLLLPSACCTKMYCLGADDLNELDFYRFASTDIDTIIIKRYDRNVNLTLPIDSSTIITPSFYNESEYQVIYLIDRIDVNFNYKVIISSTGQTFTITDFVVKKEKCNTGFLCTDQYNSLESYTVNGVRQFLGQIRISN